MSDHVVISVKNLKTYFYTNERCNRAINGVSMDIKSGKTLCIVGESGCGKSVTATSIMQLLPKLSRIEEGEIIYHSGDERGDIRIHELERSSREMRALRGKDIAMIFQDPMTSLNPLKKIGKQIQESIELCQGIKGEEAKKLSIEMLKKVGIPDPERRANQYPHEFSGGMRQRVVIAIAVACRPQILICDEPTTALDVTIQAQILDLIRALQRELNMTVIYITHDLGVVAEMCSRVIVMYAGKIVEEAPVGPLFNSPTHPNTQGLIASVPKLGSGVKVLPSIPGSVPDLASMPKGCRFAPRCRYATAKCHEQEPELVTVGENQRCRCWLKQEG